MSILTTNLMKNHRERKKYRKKMMSKCKLGLIDRILEMLPELHIIGYNYCGPNTDLETRLAHGVPGINKLDYACREHDISYAESKNLKWRCSADKLLILKAFKRIYAKDSKIGERIAAIIVSFLIGLKIIFSTIELSIICLRKCCCLPTKSKKNNNENIVDDV